MFLTWLPAASGQLTRVRCSAWRFMAAAILLASSAVHAQPVNTLEGVLTSVWGDPHPELGSGGALLHSLALPDGTTIALQMNGQDNLATHYFGQRVSVSGRRVANPLLQTQSQSQTALVVDSIAPSLALQGPSPAASVFGTKKVIYLLLKFQDDVAVPHPASFFTNLNNPDTPPPGELFPATINGFFNKTSWNQFSWVGDVGGVGGVGTTVGWLTLPQPKSFYAPCGWSSSCAKLKEIGDDGTALGRAQGINFKNYDNINFVLSNDLDCCAWGGGYYSSVDLKSYGATWEPPWGQETGTYAHEMGHSLGLPHSGWVYYAYDNPWDMMSDRRAAQSVLCGSYNSTNSSASRSLYCTEPGNGYITAYKDYLGWIPPANQMLTSNTSASSTVTLEAGALPLGALPKMVKICITGSLCTGPTAHYFTVEARVKALGVPSQFDNGLPGEGIIIHEFQGNRPAVSGPCFFNSSSGWAWPMDALPADYDGVNCNTGGRIYPNYALYNAQWNVGQTYNNSTYGFSVAVVSRTGSNFDVTVGAATFYPLSVAKAGSGAGTVSSAPAGIDCGATCSASFVSANPVTLTAAATAGSSFTGWSGACTGTGSCVVNMSAPQGVTATFAANVTYALTLTAAPAAGGALSGAGNFAAGTSQTVTATANPGYAFVAWSGYAGCASVNPCTFTMPANPVGLTATFSVALPDLLVTTLTAPATGTAGGVITINTTVDNQGMANAGAYRLGFYFSTDAVITASDTFSGTSCAMPAVPPATPYGCTGDVSVPASLAPGTYYFGAFADDLGAVSESDETNNTRSTQIVISAAPTLSNISTRGQVRTADNVMIGGFIISGSTPKTVLIRARGPSLTPFGVVGALANPTVSLYSGATALATNDNWGSAANAADITATGLAPTNSFESAILTTLPPGPYTAIVSGVGSTSGVGIVEVLEIDNPASPLSNISTRGRVETGASVLIGGFVISGTTPKTVLIRARGPSLTPFGVVGALANPMMSLYSGSTVLASNDDWGTAVNAADITATGLAPTNALESAILTTLPPGAYTVIVQGVGGTSGVGIVEVLAQ